VNRNSLIALATDAARDPSRAARLAAWIADELRAQKAAGETATPEGYLYQGAFEWVITAEDLAIEPLTGGPDITSSVNPFIPLRVPFDALIVGMSGWAVARPSTLDTAQAVVAAELASAEDGRDLFSLVLGMDGQIQFGTDGHNPLMFPASCVVGTRLHPRIAAWTVRRNQVIQAKFRNMTNLYLDGINGDTLHTMVVDASVGFTVLNLGSP
jgi:hypothetical protein